MSISTWHNTLAALPAAVHDSYMAKTARQRSKREVQRVMADVDTFCRQKQTELKNNTYRVGPYRHFRLTDKKKERDISVLPYPDRCVQNAVKDAIQPLLLRQMTDDMLGGLPERGVLSAVTRYSVVKKIRRLMNDKSLRYYLQGDIRKFYDSIDNVVAMRLIEQKVKDQRTRALIRQHIFNQKRLAIGDPFSHLIANLVMSCVIRKAKAKYGRRIHLINFADDFIAFAKDKATLTALRSDMNRWAKTLRLHYKPLYIRPVPRPHCAWRFSRPAPITFCGYRFGPGYVHLTRRTKLRYIRTRHRRRSLASYQGILAVADTRHLIHLIQYNDNHHMTEKIRRPFAGRPMKIETLEGIPHTIVNVVEKPSRQRDSETYMHVQAIADGLGLIVYSTAASKICAYLRAAYRPGLPLTDMRIVHDWSGYYYEGTVYTDAEEEEMIRKQYNIPK